MFLTLSFSLYLQLAQYVLWFYIARWLSCKWCPALWTTQACWSVMGELLLKIRYFLRIFLVKKESVCFLYWLRFTRWPILYYPFHILYFFTYQMCTLFYLFLLPLFMSLLKHWPIFLQYCTSRQHFAVHKIWFTWRWPYLVLEKLDFPGEYF